MNKPLDVLKKPLKRLFVQGRLSKIEPLIFSRSFDVHQRYSPVAELIRSASSHSLSILEVGAGGSGISGWLEYTQCSFVTLVDADANRLKGIKGESRSCECLIADGCQLPFVNNSFDIVLSLDTLEHIDKGRRIKFTDELKRVTKEKIIIHVPLAPVAIIGDKKFAKTHKRLFRVENRPTKEHIMFGQPTQKELKELFPKCELKLFQNLVIWYVTAVLARLRVIGWLTGLLYVTILSRFDKNPPFYGCMLIWHK